MMAYREQCHHHRIVGYDYGGDGDGEGLTDTANRTMDVATVVRASEVTTKI